MADYVPRSDNDFMAWSQAWEAGVTTGQVDPTLFTVAELTALSTAGGEFRDSLPNLVIAQGSARHARETKDQKREVYEGLIRSYSRRIQAHPATTNGVREILGLPVPDDTRSAATATVLEGHRVEGWVDTSERLRHSIHFSDIATPRSTAKPKGVKGCEIWRKIGAAPTFVSGAPVDMEFVALDTATPYAGEFSSADAGKTAYYVLRWIANDDSKGAWSETIEATIVG